MSITFRPAMAEEIEITSHNFNPYEPEDSIYNPRYEFEYNCPVLNLANANAFTLMQKLRLKEGYTGDIYDVEAVMQTYRKLYFENDTFIRNYGLRLERVLATCIKMKSNLIWS